MYHVIHGDRTGSSMVRHLHPKLVVGAMAERAEAELPGVA